MIRGTVNEEKNIDDCFDHRSINISDIHMNTDSFSTAFDLYNSSRCSYKSIQSIAHYQS